MANQVLASMSNDLATLGEAALKRQGVELILNDQVQSFTDGKVYKVLMHMHITMQIMSIFNAALFSL